jgi:hypothetical protein
MRVSKEGYTEAKSPFIEAILTAMDDREDDQRT